MSHFFAEAWFDAVIERWAVTLWMSPTGDLDPAADRFYTLEATHTDRSVAATHARQIVEVLRGAGYKAKVLPMRARWLEDSAEDVTDALIGHMGRLEDDDRRIAEALVGVVAEEQRLGVVMALEGRL